MTRNVSYKYSRAMCAQSSLINCHDSKMNKKNWSTSTMPSAQQAMGFKFAIQYIATMPINKQPHNANVIATELSTRGCVCTSGWAGLEGHDT